jgi:hypothetical protein
MFYFEFFSNYSHQTVQKCAPWSVSKALGEPHIQMNSSVNAWAMLTADAFFIETTL